MLLLCDDINMWNKILISLNIKYNVHSSSLFILRSREATSSRFVHTINDNSFSDIPLNACQYISKYSSSESLYRSTTFVIETVFLSVSSTQ